MSKPGAHKKKYDAYKSSGRKEINKREREVKNQRRIERFAKRKEDGKAYEYSKEHTTEKIKAVFGRKLDNLENKEELLREFFKSNKGSNRGRHTEYAKWTSAKRKLDNELNKLKTMRKMAVNEE